MEGFSKRLKVATLRCFLLTHGSRPFLKAWKLIRTDGVNGPGDVGRCNQANQVSWGFNQPRGKAHDAGRISVTGKEATFYIFQG